MCDLVRHAPLLTRSLVGMPRSHSRFDVSVSAQQYQHPSQSGRKQLLIKRWNHMSALQPPRTRARACTIDKVGQYQETVSPARADNTEVTRYSPIYEVQEYFTGEQGGHETLCNLSCVHLLLLLTRWIDGRASRRSHRSMLHTPLL